MPSCTCTEELVVMSRGNGQFTGMAHSKGFEAESLGKIAITLDVCDVARRGQVHPRCPTGQVAAPAGR